MTFEESINEQIASYVKDSLEGEIVSMEENCGSMWITTDSGKVYSIMVMECEPEEEDEFEHTRNQFDTPEQD